MKKCILLSVIILFGSCKTVPLTGRKGVDFIPSSQIQSLSYNQYQSVLDTSRLSSNTEWTRWVKTSGNNIKGAVEKYLQQAGHSELTEGYSWEFNLLVDNIVNAWCMPGGKVAFYEGIMPVCQNEAGVAVVMGHEVSHAIAQHGGERMSQQLAQQGLGMALSVYASQKPELTQQLIMTGYAIGSQYAVLLPFSRLHESEADELGLYFMAMAGYDPREAPKFWERMSSMSNGAAPPEFLSTHPSHSTRIKNLNKWMPQAIEYYNASNKQD